jgi:uncharacterized Ntn-hydrolase superfamily protein
VAIAGVSKSAAHLVVELRGRYGGSSDTSVDLRVDVARIDPVVLAHLRART